MKLGLPGALLACVCMSNAVANDGVAQLRATTAQKEASIWAARVLSRYRYKSEGQPDGIGARPFDRFVEALDPEHMVFTQADLASMASKRDLLDKLTDERQMDIPIEIATLYVARSIALHEHALELLAQPLDFKKHEHFQRVRSKAAREPDEAALRDLWRRRVIDDYLNLRLSGTPEAKIVPTLQSRYDRNLQRVQTMQSDDVANMFLNAYVEYLDPHGAYSGPEKATAEHKPDDMIGTGMVLEKKEDLITIREVVAGSPADHSGDIGPGDRIVGVAQGRGQAMMDVIGWQVDDVIALMRGMPGSTIELNILPQGAPRRVTPRRVPLMLAQIDLDGQRVKGHVELIQHGASVNRIGVIAVPTFYEDFSARRTGAKNYVSVTRDVAAALEQMKLQRADAILLDMRNNGGGSLVEAIALTGLFLPGVPVAQQISAERKVTVETAPQGTSAWDGPLAILIGRRSAAATEITAAALQDYGRGLVIGDVSYGRGSVQTMVNLDRFSRDPAKQFGQLKMTVAMLCRADGKPIQQAGVRPDILVPGRNVVTGKANPALFPSATCKAEDIKKSSNLTDLLPAVERSHAKRMLANQSYQAQLTWRAKEETLLSSDEVTLNEVERRQIVDEKPPGDITKLQLTEALRVLSDTVDQMRKGSGAAAKMP